MAEARLSPSARARVVAFANLHGPRAAARRFGVKLGTVKGWQHRARHRPPRPRPAKPKQAEPAVPSPAEAWLAEARRLVEWAAKGACLQCGGAGSIRVPAATRGELVIRRAMTIPCPTCGGPPRHIQVTEWPRDAWVAGLAVAGDLGFGRCVHGVEHCGWCADA